MIPVSDKTALLLKIGMWVALATALVFSVIFGRKHK